MSQRKGFFGRFFKILKHPSQNMIDPSLQINCVNITIFFAFLITFPFFVLNYFFYDKFVNLIKGHQLMSADASLLDSFLQNYFFLTLTSYFGVIMVIGLSAIGIVIFTQVILGPMVRIEKGLKELAETGKTEPLNFRRYDFFSNLTKAFNELAKKTNKI